MNKYHAEAIMVDGIRFASKREWTRYLILKDDLRLGRISRLEVHPHYDFLVNGYAVGRGYTGDFRYLDREGVEVVEEVKGCAARDWPLRRDLFLALYPSVRLLVNGKELKRRKS